MPSLAPEFFGRLAAPRYSPDRRKTFRLADWGRVAEVAARHLEDLGLEEPAAWYRAAACLPAPYKADQDRLDAMLCLLVGLHWRLRDRALSMLLGSLTDGYMVLPASPEVRGRLMAAAGRVGINAV